MVHGLIHGKESFGSVNDEFFDGTLVVFNRLKQRISEDCGSLRLKTYIFHVDDGVNSGNGCLCQSSTETSLDLPEQHFHTGPSDYEYIFGC